MADLEIKYVKNSISDLEMEYIKKHIPNRYNNSLKYLSIEARNASLLAGILIFNNLGIDEMDIKYNKLNKPYIDNGLYFNISHSNEYIVFVKSEDKIGVDIELVDEKNMCLLDYAYDNIEKDYIKNGIDYGTSIERLIKLWTIKESVFKASSTEERIEPKNIIVSNHKKVEFLNEVYNVHTLKFFSHIISTSSIMGYDSVKLVKDKVIY
ncbi:MAG: 4'-phosphopantetheinyl transferase superfamily protein [Lachnospiraceae bacterium]|nr:4'-phosphopantetheinyl transferase superfamily protein [Lachnospiraceae bacterium]